MGSPYATAPNCRKREKKRGKERKREKTREKREKTREKREKKREKREKERKICSGSIFINLPSILKKKN